MENLDLSHYPIGIFDSGFGGLTVMRAVRELLPDENILYLGDAARLPYGNKSRETILRYTQESCQFLAGQKVKLIIIACHTASAQALSEVAGRFSLPIVGMVEPSLPELKKSAEKGKIAIIGTQGTISSKIYQNTIQTEVPKAEITALACPLFVPLVEEGLMDSPITKESIKHYLQEIKQDKVKTVLLACTHYPLLTPLIQSYLGPECSLIDPAIHCAKHVNYLMQSQGLMNTSSQKGVSVFYTTDDPEKFKHFGEKFLGTSIAQVNKVAVSL